MICKEFSTISPPPFTSKQQNDSTAILVRSPFQVEVTRLYQVHRYEMNYRSHSLAHSAGFNAASEAHAFKLRKPRNSHDFTLNQKFRRQEI